jgi:hypothetical protein
VFLAATRLWCRRFDEPGNLYDSARFYPALTHALARSMGFDLARDFPGLGKAMSRLDADHFGKSVHDTRSEEYKALEQA